MRTRLNRRVVDQMLIGVATRQYARSLEPLGADVTTRGTSKRAVSRRFVAQTQAQLDAWRATPLDALALAGLLIDGVHVGGHCIVVALGIDKTGAKHPLGLWEGATENATVCQGLQKASATRHAIETAWPRSLRFLTSTLANEAFRLHGDRVAMLAAGAARDEPQVERVVLRIQASQDPQHAAAADFDLRFVGDAAGRRRDLRRRAGLWPDGGAGRRPARAGSSRIRSVAYLRNR